jgi:hypothetical protein
MKRPNSLFQVVILGDVYNVSASRASAIAYIRWFLPPNMGAAASIQEVAHTQSLQEKAQ